MRKSKITQAIVSTLAILPFVISGCSSSPTEMMVKDQLKAQELIDKVESKQIEANQEKAIGTLSLVPDWFFSNTQLSDDAIYSKAMASSDQIDTAIKKANLKAQFELAKQINAEIIGNEQFVNQDNQGSNDTEQYTLLIDSFVNKVELTGHEVVKNEIRPIDGKYTAYVLLKLPYDKIASYPHNDSTLSKDEVKASFDELLSRAEE